MSWDTNTEGLGVVWCGRHQQGQKEGQKEGVDNTLILIIRGKQCQLRVSRSQQGKRGVVGRGVQLSEGAPPAPKACGPQQGPSWKQTTQRASERASSEAGMESEASGSQLCLQQTGEEAKARKMKRLNTHQTQTRSLFVLHLLVQGIT